MELIRVGDFKMLLERVLNKKIHKTTFSRYKDFGFVPRGKQGAKIINIDITKSIRSILNYEKLTNSEKIKLGFNRRENNKCGGLAFKLMNKTLTN